MTRGAREARERAAQFRGRRNKRSDDGGDAGMSRRRTRSEERAARQEGRGEKLRQLKAQDAVTRIKEKARAKADREEGRRRRREEGDSQERAERWRSTGEEKRKKRLEGYRPYNSTLDESKPVFQAVPTSVGTGAAATDTKAS